MTRKITDYYLNGVFEKRVILTIPENRNFICNKCDYLWETRKRIGDPPKCPKCNSKEIKEYRESSNEEKILELELTKDEEKEDNRPIFECGECKYLWGLGGGNSKECPNCKNKEVISYRNLKNYQEKRKQKERKREEDKTSVLKEE
ncbi:MAG: hypothetical protein AABX07_02845 [Nanoarchaeota archaeon]